MSLGAGRISLEFAQWLRSGGSNLSVDEFYNYMKRKFPNEVEGLKRVKQHVDDIKKTLTGGGNGQKPPSKPPVAKSPQPPENPNNNKGMNNQRKAEVNKELDKIYKPTSKENLAKAYQGKQIVKGNVGNFVEHVPNDVAKVSQPINQIFEREGAIGVVEEMGKRAMQGAGNAAGKVVNFGKAALPYLGTATKVVNPMLAVAPMIYENYQDEKAKRESQQRMAENARIDQSLKGKSSYLSADPRYTNTPNDMLIEDQNIVAQNTQNLHDEIDKKEAERKGTSVNTGFVPNEGVTPEYSANYPEVTNLEQIPSGELSYTGVSNIQSLNAPSDINTTGVNAPMSFQFQPYIPVGNYEQTDFEKQLGQQILNPQGNVTPEQMKGYLDNYYAQMQNTINQNPLYGGEYIQPGGYQIDEKTLSLLQNIDRATAGAGGNNINNAKEYIDSQRQMYNAQMANRAGVPYEDYVLGMTERYKQNLIAQQKQIEAQLNAYAQQTTNTANKLKYMQEIQKTRLETQRAIDVANANALGDIQQAALTGQYNIYNRQLQEAGENQRQQMGDTAAMARTKFQYTNPNAQVEAMAKMNNSIAQLLYTPQGAQILANMVKNMTPEMQANAFGRPLDPNNINDMFLIQQTAQQNPGWFQQLINKYMNK